MAPWEVTLGATTAVGLAGWVKLAYDHVTARPKLRGSILAVMTGTFEHQGQAKAGLIPYLYLTNLRRNQVHVLDYEMEVKTRTGWQRLERVYGVTPQFSPSFRGTSGPGFAIPNFADKVIWRDHTPVQYGLPHHGFLLFAGPPGLHGEKHLKYRITCVDAFGRRHAVTTRPKDMRPPYLLTDLSGVMLPYESLLPPDVK